MSPGDCGLTLLGPQAASSRSGFFATFSLNAPVGATTCCEPVPTTVNAALFAAVDVPVEHRETRKEGDANQVFHPFDVLVVIDQRVDFLDLSYGCEYFVHNALPFSSECLAPYFWKLRTETLVSDSESGDFSSWQGNQGIARRRTTVRRTRKTAD
jgi:hypothetical protein